MQFRELIEVDGEKTFGELKFATHLMDRTGTNEDGSEGALKERTYNLKCKKHGCMLRVGVPAEVQAKDFPYNADVEIINPKCGTVATPNFRGADVEWYVKADDIVLKGNRQNSQPKPESKQDVKEGK